MWKSWNAERGVSEASSTTEFNDGANSRSLQGSHPGSFTIQFDADPDMISERSSEVGFGTGRTTTPIDWVLQALNIRDRLALTQEKQNQDGGMQEPAPREPSPDYENVELLRMKEIDDTDELRAPVADPDIPEIPKLLKKYADTYEMEKYKKNAMIIFNHKDFLGGNNTRVGTMEDEDALKTTFEMFNFKVESHLDLPKKLLLKELKTFCSKNFSDYGCVCVAILTHGSKHGYLKAYDTRYSEHEVIECFDVRKNPTLLGKPIIILIQACRGKQPATACNPEGPKLPEDVEFDNDDHYDLPTESDMVIFHSSYVGRASAREVLKGSWFIQTLCEQIKLLAAFEDFESICRAVRKEVGLDREHKMVLNNESVIAKQMPVMTSTLIRSLYFRKYEGVDDVDNIRPKAENKFEENEYKAVKGFAKGAIEKTVMCNDMICGCDAYFDYMKKCLRLFIRENPRDEVAKSILTIAGKVTIENSNKYVQVEMVNLIRKYLSQNAGHFELSEAVYLEHSRCCHSARSDERDRLITCCCVS